MALWFTLAVWLVTGLLFTALYLTARDRLTAMLRDDLALAMRQLSSQIEHKKGQLIFEDETPVAVIGAYAEGLLADRTLSDESREKADIILTECRRMQRMIQQMLTLTWGQEGRYPVALECVCLTDVLQGVNDTLKDAAAQKQMTLQATCDSPVWLAADQSLLTQLFLNLVENAIKYGKDAGHITCKARQEGQHAIITVCDDGIGIAPENLEYIFDRFFRADSARNRSGSGLGLSIVQWIVQLHHGQIQVESTLGKGSCFIVTLPLIQPQDRSAGLPSR